MTTEIGRSSTSAARERLTAEDLETASIHSAAPSYISEAPSYHSTAPHHLDPVPPYSPPARNSASTPITAAHASSSSNLTPGPSAAPSRTTSTPRPQGLPPVPTGPLRNPAGEPSLREFRIPTWSNLSANPLYHRVAQRRAMAASTPAIGSRSWNLKRVPTHGRDLAVPAAASREGEEQQDRARPLEDPYLVGEAAAERARSERLARENTEEVLVLDDRRWDWFLSQTRDWQERERSWSQFRRGIETGPRGKMAHRIGAR